MNKKDKHSFHRRSGLDESRFGNHKQLGVSMIRSLKTSKILCVSTTGIPKVHQQLRASTSESCTVSSGIHKSDLLSKQINKLKIN